MWPGFEVFASIIGMFELNNLEIAVASPVEDYFLAVDDLSEAARAAVDPITGPLLVEPGRYRPPRHRHVFQIIVMASSDVASNVY